MLRLLSLAVLVLLMGNISLAEVGLPQAKVILVSETSGGLVPPPISGWSRKILIYENGKVYSSVKQNNLSAVENTLLATLPLDIVQNIIETLGNLLPGEITFPDGDDCPDASTTTYSGLNDLGLSVNFAIDTGCKLGVLDGFADAFTYVKILDGFSALSYLGIGQ